MRTSRSLKWRWTDLWLFLCAMVILGMAVHRAANASFTHDESFSYLYYPHLSVADLFLHVEPFTNNHLLNSLGMKASEQLFGTTELALRAPNLVALGLFLLYGALFMRTLPPVACVLGYPMLIGNTYVMEFFTLARGYGLSFGFMLMAVFHLYKAISTQRTFHLVVFHAASILASTANFTLMGTHVAGIITWYLWAVIRPEGVMPRSSLSKGSIVHVCMVAMAWALLSGPIRNVLSENSLDFGGKSDFYQTTLLTWAKSLLPGHEEEALLVKAVQATMVVATLLAVVVLATRSWSRKGTFDETFLKLFVVTSMLVLTCIGAEMQHLLFGVDRLMDRFALFLVPLVVLLFILLTQEATKPVMRIAALSLLAAGAVHASATFLRGFGPYRSIEWQYDVNTKQAVRAVLHDLEKAPPGHSPVTVSGNWMLDPGWSFYKEIWHLDDLAGWDRSLEHGAEIRLLLYDDQPGEGYREIARFPESSCVVLRRIVDNTTEKAGAQDLPAE